MGSPFYLAPEQAAMSQVDSRTDLYCLGATLYHLVTGKVPFDGETPFDIIEQVISTPPPDPKNRNPNISSGFSRVIQRLMAKKKADRYGSPEELRGTLEFLLKKGRLPEDPVPLLERIFGWFARLFGRG